MNTFHKSKLAIIGGTGTLGRAVVDLIAKSDIKPSEIRIISRDEQKQLEMMDEYADKEFAINYLIGDVRDIERMDEVLDGIDMVIHAAAIKHVVIAEKNPKECYKTNVKGTQNVVEACLLNNVKRALLISSDKAEQPIGVYGKSKLEAEGIFLSQEEGDCVFSSVRLGNIVGSRGSVFENFQKNRSQLQVSHPEATRFFISKEEAAKFTIDALLSNPNGTFTFPQMKAFKVLDLAKAMCPNCDIVLTGLREGDKIHEELNGVSSKDQLINVSEVIKLLRN